MYRGHNTQVVSPNTHTMETKKARNREWENTNPEKVREMARKSRLKHKERRIADNKAWLEKNKEHSTQYHKTYNKAWYEKNKETRTKQIKEYAQKHKSDAVRRTQKYIANNKDKFLAYRHSYNRTIGAGYLSYKSRALKTGKEFDFSSEEFSALVGLPCRYCGDDSTRIGVDRVDNTLGYTKENAAPCCKMCNFMKRDYSVEQFLSHVQRIARYNT